MDLDYRGELFEAYDRRTVALDPDERSKIAWFVGYVQASYLPHLPLPATHTTVLDVGCNRGYLLAALTRLGFQDLHGIDLSAREIDYARQLVPGVELHAVEAVKHLHQHQGAFDVIIAKAVLEHVPKDATLTFLRALQRGLRPGGRVIIDVPNMDWLFASHERYMDFTHETGFTKESLTQVLGQVFTEVEVRPVDWLPASLLGGLRTRMTRRVLGTLLSWAHPEGGSNPVWARSIVGVAR